MADPQHTLALRGPDASPAATDTTTLITELSEELRTVARAYCAGLAALTPLADRLADLEGRLRAAQHRIDVFHDPRPPARELAAEVAHGHLQALRPYVPLVTAESMRRSESALARPGVITTWSGPDAASRGQ